MVNLPPFSPFAELARQLLPLCHSEADGAHDLSHLERVWHNTQAIHAAEGGDLEALAAAVLLHDCVQVAKNSPMHEKAGEMAAIKARSLLESLCWEVSRVDLVANAIATHSYSAGLEPTSREGSILQDADRLDAIGLIGVARCFYTAGRMGSSLYSALDPAGMQRPLDDAAFALDHFPKKLLLLADGFRTAAGRQLAAARHQALQTFYDGLLLEIGSPIFPQ